MSAIAISKKVSNKFLTTYNDLSNKKKAELQDKFCKEFDYRSFDSFYKKKNQETKFWANEQRWLAKYLKTTVEELFPEKN